LYAYTEHSLYVKHYKYGDGNCKYIWQILCVETEILCFDVSWRDVSYVISKFSEIDHEDRGSMFLQNVFKWRRHNAFRRYDVDLKRRLRNEFRLDKIKRSLNTTS
jgi:hypothetical protein